MAYCIVGDGVAGHTAAETIREEDGDADIHVFTDEPVPFYDRIGLRDYVRGGRDRDALLLHDTDWYAAHDIDLHLDTRVTGIDPGAQELATADGATYPYDALLLATGGTPRTLPMEDGVDRAHHLWTLHDDGIPLRERLADADRGVVVGGGLLGFDLIASFSRANVTTTYLIREDHWWSSTLTPEGGAIMHDAMQDHGIDVHAREELTDLRQEGEVVHVDTDADSYTVDVVGMAIGNQPNVQLAADAGLTVDDGIVCDATLRTSDPHIYAAGTVARYQDPVLGQRHRGGSWVTAQAQGERAGRNMVGDDRPVDFVDTYTVSHFDRNVASLGDPARDGETIIAVDRDSGRYRKLVLDEGRIVGAAIIGGMQWMHPLKQLIHRKTDVAGDRDLLHDLDADLSQLV